ncbi:hypothetical protein HYC85_030641 [Camellia sinensis]|uniref:Uncharacterized protein n=1 Tax=Camellia sinensis TaxID=4442 RepID=A0A7J7G185_CAMSI|nr:hypothetical protein HYC85_030641 [Camellia sinensis]
MGTVVYDHEKWPTATERWSTRPLPPFGKRKQNLRPTHAARGWSFRTPICTYLLGSVQPSKFTPLRTCGLTPRNSDSCQRPRVRYHQSYLSSGTWISSGVGSKQRSRTSKLEPNGSNLEDQAWKIYSHSRTSPPFSRASLSKGKDLRQNDLFLVGSTAIMVKHAKFPSDFLLKASATLLALPGECLVRHPNTSPALARGHRLIFCASCDSWHPLCSPPYACMEGFPSKQACLALSILASSMRSLDHPHDLASFRILCSVTVIVLSLSLVLPRALVSIQVSFGQNGFVQHFGVSRHIVQVNPVLNRSAKPTLELPGLHVFIVGHVRCKPRQFSSKQRSRTSKLEPNDSNLEDQAWKIYSHSRTSPPFSRASLSKGKDLRQNDLFLGLPAVLTISSDTWHYRSPCDPWPLDLEFRSLSSSTSTVISTCAAASTRRATMELIWLGPLKLPREETHPRLHGVPPRLGLRPKFERDDDPRLKESQEIKDLEC